MLAQALGGVTGLQAACASLSVSRASLYRRLRPAPPCRSPLQRSAAVATAGESSCHPGALKAEEKQLVLAHLQDERFMDQAPRQVWATLLDEGIYLCSVSSMYRLLRQEEQVCERRRQRRHGRYAKPELLATAPNQVWSWDITKLKGPVKWSYYCLYVILDIFSRYVVGWMLAERESERLARQLIEETCHKQGIVPGQLSVHADRGGAMTSNGVAALLSGLGVKKTHSRPHVSNDNPYSEAQFKTLKYCPDFPARFGSLEDARRFCADFFGFYNTQHRHSGLALLTPETVHYGLADAALATRQAVLNQAYATHPQRFSRQPQVPVLPEEVWINPPVRALEPVASSPAQPRSRVHYA